MNCTFVADYSRMWPRLWVRFLTSRTDTLNTWWWTGTGAPVQQSTCWVDQHESWHWGSRPPPSCPPLCFSPPLLLAPALFSCCDLLKQQLWGKSLTFKTGSRFLHSKYFYYFFFVSNRDYIYSHDTHSLILFPCVFFPLFSSHTLLSVCRSGRMLNELRLLLASVWRFFSSSAAFSRRRRSENPITELKVRTSLKKTRVFIISFLHLYFSRRDTSGACRLTLS